MREERHVRACERGGQEELRERLSKVSASAGRLRMWVHGNPEAEHEGDVLADAIKHLRAGIRDGIPSEGQEDYPHKDGDFTVLGPEIFASADAEVICWRGENYVKQRGGQPPAAEERQ